MMTGRIVILCTCGSAEEAAKIARMLVEQRLAACVSVAPRVISYYRWQGALESAEEHLLLIKTSADLFGAVEAAIRKEHSYEVPEVIAIPIAAGSEPYLNWLDTSLRRE